MQHLADLFVAEVLEVAQHDGHAEFLRKAGDRVPDLFPRSIDPCPMLRERDFVAAAGPEQGVQEEKSTRLALVILPGIADDPVKPAVELRLPAKLPQAQIHLAEDILRDLRRVGWALGEEKGEPVDAALVPMEKEP